MKHQMTYTLFVIGIVMVVGCGQTETYKNDLSDVSTEELVWLLEDTEGSSDIFPDVIKELTTRGPAASVAAPALAKALVYNRRDSTIASRPLVAMGSAAKSAIPILFENLGDERADV